MGDFDRLILGLPPPPMPEEIPPPEAPRAPETHPTVATPSPRTPEDHDHFLRSQPNLTPYLNPDHLSRWSGEVSQWFVGDTEQAQANRMNYTARDTALSLTFLAFHQSNNPEERLRLAHQFVDYARGYFETLRDLGRAGNLRHMSTGLLRLSHTVGFFLRDLESSGLAREEIQGIQGQIQTILRDSYSRMDSAIGSDATWAYLQEFAQARVQALTPPASSSPVGDYISWVGEIRTHLQNSQQRLSEISSNTPNREEWSALVQSDLGSLPSVPSDSQMARDFIRQMTSSFVLLIATEIDLENGDSRETVEGRANTLRQALERAFQSTNHASENFFQVLQGLAGPEAAHLRELIQGSRLLTEISSFDPTASRFSGQNLTQIVNTWGQFLLDQLQNHELNWSENFFGSHEQHLGATRAILEFFRSSNGSPSPLSQTLRDSSGQGALDSALSDRAVIRLNSLSSSGFGLENGLSHFFSLRTLPFVFGTALLSRATQAGLLALAGETGELTLFGARSVPLIRAGEFTRTGHFVMGTLVGAELTLFTSGSQLISDLRAGRPEAWSNFGRNFGLGLFINTVAFGISAGITGAYRSSFGNRAATESTGERALAGQGRIGSFLRRTLLNPVLVQGTVGTVGMIGANGIVRGIHNTAHPNERVPLIALDETVETFLNMVAINLAELPMQRLFLRQQLGRFRTARLDALTQQIMTRHAPPSDSSPYSDRGLTSEASMNLYDRVFNLLALHSLRGVPLETLRREEFGASVARRIGFSTSPGTPASTPVAAPTPAAAPARPPVDPIAPGAAPATASNVHLAEGETPYAIEIAPPQILMSTDGRTIVGEMMGNEPVTPGDPQSSRRVTLTGHVGTSPTDQREVTLQFVLTLDQVRGLRLRPGVRFTLTGTPQSSSGSGTPSASPAAPQTRPSIPPVAPSTPSRPRGTMSRNAQGQIEIPPFTDADLQMGDPMHLVREEGVGFAAISYRGIGYVDEAGHLKNNEDRHLIMTFPDGRRVSVVIDGAGGHVGGERAAEIAHVIIRRALEAGESVEDAIDLAHRAVLQDNRRQGIRMDHPFGVLIAVEEIPNPDGTYRGRFFSLGDSEAVALRPRPDRLSPPEVIHWTLQPSPMVQVLRQQSGLPTIPTLPDGRIARGHTLIHHTAPGANYPTNGFGGNGRSLNGRPHITEVTLQRGDQIVLTSDGGMESLSSYDVVARLPFQSGATTEAQTRDVLFLETLICMSLARQQGEAGAAIELTHPRYVEAYRETTGEEPPANWRGSFEGHQLNESLDVLNGRGQTVAHFKPDNVTMIVQTVGAEAPLCAAPLAPPSPPPPISSEPAATPSAEPQTSVVTQPVVPVGGGDASETQVLTTALRRAIEYFQTLRTHLEQSVLLDGDQPAYVVYQITESSNGPEGQEIALRRTRPDSLTANQILLEISNNRSGERQVRVADLNTGNLSESVLTALLGNFPSAEDMTLRFPQQMQAMVQRAERVLVLVDLLEEVLPSSRSESVRLPIYWDPVRGFSTEAPRNRSSLPLTYIIQDGPRLRSEQSTGQTQPGPMEIMTLLSDAIRSLQQRQTRRQP